VSITVEVFFTPGCDRCEHAKGGLREVVHAMTDQGVFWRDVDLLENLDYAVDLGIVGASAIAIDGELVFPGLPKPEALRQELERRLATQG
jgi:thioredoxin 1